MRFSPWDGEMDELCIISKIILLSFSQLTPVGSTIFKNVDAFDADAGVNGIVEYSIAPGDGSRIGSNEGVGRNRITTADGYGYFSINLPHQGQVTVNRTLDYERTQRYLVTILASVSFDLVLIKLIDRSSPELRMKVEIDQDIDSDVGAEIMTYHLRSQGLVNVMILTGF